MVDRINLFHENSLKLTTGEGINYKRISSEIQKMRKWMQKHQDESVPDSSKTKLMSAITKYRAATSVCIDLEENVYMLLDDFLKMPEGKLVSSRDKTVVLKWLQAMSGDQGGVEQKDSDDNSTASYIVGDINDDNTLLLMSPDPNQGDILENVIVEDSALLERIIAAFNSSDNNFTVYVEVSKSDVVVLSCYVEDVDVVLSDAEDCKSRRR